MTRPDGTSPAAPEKGAGPAIRPVEWQPRSLRDAAPRRRFPSPVTLLGIFLVLVLGAGAAFVFNARTVTLETAPPADRLSVESGFAVAVGQNHLMLPGEYRLRAVKEGYEALETSFSVDGAARQSFRFELVPLPEEPLEPVPVAEEVTAPPDDPVVPAPPPPAPPPPPPPPPRAKLAVATVPPGAAVAVDGAFYDAAPVELELAPGSYEVRLSKAGHQPAVRTVELQEAEDAVLEVELEPLFGEVELVVQPADARLVVDGEPAAGPVLRLTAVEHEIVVEKEGYEPYRATVTPIPGVSQRLVVDLESRARAAAEAAAAGAPAPRIETSEGHELLLVEPARFTMGASRREPGRRANETLREVEITRPFYLATEEVSNRQFRRFDEAHRSGQIGGHNLEVDHHPAVRMTHGHAAEYCNWLSRQEGLPEAYVRRGASWVLADPPTPGYRLPTEAEWALATRGMEGLKYPWGGELPVPPSAGNYADASAREYLQGIIPGYSDGYPATAPVDSFAANARGFKNLGGNVAEWVHDVYALRPPAARLGALEKDPLGPEEGDLHVIRGSSFLHSTVTELRSSFRDYGSDPRPDVGFRIARWVEGP